MQRCIKCGGEARAFSPEAGITLSLCRACKGMWFPRGMLARRLGTEADIPHASLTQATPTPLNCPTCAGTSLVEVKYGGDARLSVDACAKCGGVYLDAQELKVAAQLAQSMPRAVRRPPATTATPPRTASPGFHGAAAVAMAPPVASLSAFEAVMARGGALFVKQRKEWTEILTDFETRNKYDLFDAEGMPVGHIAEHANGIAGTLGRLFLKTRRTFEASVWNVERQPMLAFRRPFFWFFSDIYVTTVDGRPIGSAHHKFNWLTARYELCDATGRLFAVVRKPIFSLWRFPIFTPQGGAAGQITRKWGGVMKELFTSADTYALDFGGGTQSWRASERAVMLALSLAIDLDFFDSRGKGRGGNAVFDLLRIFGD